MSNHFAVATVTATLQQILDKAVSTDVAGAHASMARPDGAGAGIADPGVNVFLYQVTPNTAARNEDLPTRSADGTLLRRPRIGLDLHYLLTFYGRDDQFEPQRVLGSAVRTLHAKPVLNRPQIEDALTAFPVLALSDLSHEVELVKFTQLSLTLEELSKLWSVFFQTAYHLSVAYRGTVVFLETDDSFSSALPVRLRNVYAETLREPVVTEVVAFSGDERPITDGGQIRIRGETLSADTVEVLVDGAQAAVGTVTDREVTATLPTLHAGVHGLKIRHPRKLGTPAVDHPGGGVSNLFPFVLTPTIRKPGPDYDITLSNQTTRTEGLVTYDSADIQIGIDPIVGKEQRVSFLLNELGATPAHAYTFSSEFRTADANMITIRAVDVIPGTYLVRVQIDGVESRLELTGNSYTDPAVTL